MASVLDRPKSSKKAKGDSRPNSGVPAVAVNTSRVARMSGFGEPQNLSVTLDVQRIQNALRAAERGDVWMLFTIYRDMIAGYAHLQAEWGKRKAVITGQAESLVPYSSDADDVMAANVIRQMITHCRNWYDGVDHLLDATLYPMSAVEKVYAPVDLSDAALFKYPVRFILKELAPIPYALFCYKIPYFPRASSPGTNPATAYNPDDWEGWLRFYETTPTGGINWSTSAVYQPDPNIHIVHRGNLIGTGQPPNFGGQMRPILFWWLLATQDRDWWALMMNKYGMPFIAAGVDAQQKDTITFMQGAVSLASQLGGIVYDKKAMLELMQANATDGSNSHKIFNDYCNCEVSKIVIGQVLSSTPKNTGLGSGMAAQAEEVREDIRQFDTTKLSDTLAKQLFKPYLQINGYRGNPPLIRWGGMREGAAATFSKTLAQLKQGGLRLTEEGLQTASNKFGFGIEIDPNPKPAGAFGAQ